MFVRLTLTEKMKQTPKMNIFPCLCLLVKKKNVFVFVYFHLLIFETNIHTQKRT